MLLESTKTTGVGKVVDLLKPLVDEHVEAYHADFDIDLEQFDKLEPGESALWLCRPCGTNMFPLVLDCPTDPAWFTYWVDQGQAFRVVTVLGAGFGKVREITADRARAMANDAAAKARIDGRKRESLWSPDPDYDGRRWAC